MVEVRYPDDPTIGVAIRIRPSFLSYSNNPDVPVLLFLWLDELSYPGAALFRSMANGGWLVAPVMVLAFAVESIRRQQKNRSDPEG